MHSFRFAFVFLASGILASAYGCSSAPPGMDGPTEDEERASAARDGRNEGGSGGAGGTAGAGTVSDAGASGPCVCVTFDNPVAVANLPVLQGGSPDLQNVPEGLMLVGDDGKPVTELHTDWDTVVFTHGWAREGKAENFPSPAIWRGKKFNTLIYRWHRRSFEPGIIPIEASKRIPAVSVELAGLLDGLRTKLGAGASKEIRLVGHSLGGMVMAYTADKFFSDAGRSVRRLELLDPAYLFDFTDAGKETVPNGTDGGTVSYSEAGRKLAALTQAGVHVVSYNSVVAKLWGQNDTWTTVNVQETSPNWQKGDLVNQHNAIVPYYFESFAKAPPPVEGASEPGFSASLPTEAITKTPRRFEQIAGIETTGIEDDRYKKK